MTGVNRYNQETRQGQAAAERRFVEGRLSEARDSLRAAEDRLERFSKTNVQIGGSRSLQLERDRITRDVIQRQALVSGLTQSYEDVRIREVRDTPVITELEAPSVSPRPVPRGRTKAALIGFAVGGFFLSLAYSDMLYTLAALAVGLGKVART
jgi:uncharacterized protein involved in exopolysaccharide biosynthesis